ncbi:hypothetical protein EZS27_044417, partial [termite gut metagenome]
MVFTVSTVDFSGERSGGIPERFSLKSKNDLKMSHKDEIVLYQPDN